MPTSSSAATLTFKNLGTAFPPQSPDIGVATVIKKEFENATFSLRFTEASIKDPNSGKGITISAERSLGEGVKGFISYDVGAHNVMGTVSLDKNVNGSDLQLKAIYKHVGDVFVLEETWRFDSKNKLAGSYNFATEEANFAYTYSSGDYSATARYNFQSDESSLEVTKRDGKNSYSASYCPNKEDAMISWSAKPYKATLKSKIGKGGVRDHQAALVFTHEFEI